MSSQQLHIDLIVKWFTRIMVGIAAFLLVGFANEMRLDIREMKSDIRTVMEKQASQDERIRSVERIIYK